MFPLHGVSVYKLSFCCLDLFRFCNRFFLWIFYDKYFACSYPFCFLFFCNILVNMFFFSCTHKLEMILSDRYKVVGYLYVFFFSMNFCVWFYDWVCLCWLVKNIMILYRHYWFIFWVSCFFSKWRQRSKGYWKWVKG